MYSQKLNISQLHKTTIGKRWIKIRAPQKSKSIKWLKRISLLIIVTFVVFLTGYQYCPECIAKLLSLSPSHEDTAHSSCQVENHLGQPNCSSEQIKVPNHANNTHNALQTLPPQESSETLPVNVKQESIEKVQTLNQPKLTYFDPLPSNFVELPISAEMPSKSAITKLLRKCETHFKANRLTVGKGGTAFDCYHKVLAQEANNVQAKKGIAKIAKRYQYWAENALKNGKLQSARKYITQLRRVTPNSPALFKLQRRLQAQSVNQPKVKQRSKSSAKEPQVKASKPRSKASQPRSKKRKRSSSLALQCSNILSQESLGIVPLSQEQRRFKQQHCSSPKK